MYKINNLLIQIVWNPDPILFEIGAFKMTWYGALWGLSILLGYYVSRHIYHKKGRSERNLVTLIEYVVIGSILGARLGQVILYEPAYFLANPLEILQIWKGGLASHGAVLGTLLAVFLYCKRYKDIGMMEVLDGLAIVIPLCASLVRIGNLFNSEIIGKPTQVVWAFIFVQIDNVPRHPSQLYDMLLVFVIFLGLLFLFNKKHHELKVGTLTGLFFVLAFSLRPILEFFKADASRTQLFSIPIVILGLIILTLSKKNFFSTPTR